MADRSKVQDILSDQLDVLRLLPSNTNSNFVFEGRIITDVLYVSLNGDNSNGLTWETAFNNIKTALNTATTEDGCITLILTAPGLYDIDATGDPTYSGNYIIAGSNMSWTAITNTHINATSILTFNGFISLQNLMFDMGVGDVNGVIIDCDSYRISNCIFQGEDITGPCNAVTLGLGTTTRRYGEINVIHINGNPDFVSGLYLNNVSNGIFADVYINNCVDGIKIIHANSDFNVFRTIGVGGCGIGINIDAGNRQHFDGLYFNDNTRNIDDEVGDHIWAKVTLRDPPSSYLIPADLVGEVVNTGIANTYGADTVLIDTDVVDNPFWIVGISYEFNSVENYGIRISANSGLTHFIETILETWAAGETNNFQMPTILGENLWNKGTRISASSKCVSGTKVATLWLLVVEI